MLWQATGWDATAALLYGTALVDPDPKQVVTLLNELFSLIDELVARHGVYKVVSRRAGRGTDPSAVRARVVLKWCAAERDAARPAGEAAPHILVTICAVIFAKRIAGLWVVCRVLELRKGRARAR
jgi:hypothetical protein